MKMKGSNFKIAAFLTAVVAGIAIFAACGKISDIQSDIALTINPNVISIPLSVQFLDAKPGGDVVGDVTVKVTGQDADKLYTGSAGVLAGTHQVKGGILQVAVKKRDLPTTSRPLSFTMEIDAPGYMKAYRSFVIVDQNARIETVNLVNTASPPSGVNTKNAAVKLQNGASGSATVDAGNASLSIVEGTTFFDSLQRQLTSTNSNLNVQLSYFDGDLARATFPGGVVSNTALDSLNGKILGPLSFTPVGYAIVRMDVGGVTVAGFSFNGVSLTLRVDPNMVNPNTKKLVQAGDEIPFWNYDENFKIWFIAGSTKIYSSSGLLLSTFTITRPGYWSAGFYNNVSLVGNFIRFPDNIRGMHYVEIVDAKTGEVLRASRELIDSAHIDLLLFVPAVKAYVKLYDISNNCNGGLVAQSNQFDLSNSSGLPSVVQLVFSSYQTKSIAGSYALSLKGTCQSQKNVLLETSSAVSIYFRKSSCSNKTWINVPYQNGHFVFTGQLNVRESYDFIVLAFGRAFADNNVVISQESSDVVNGKPGSVIPVTDPANNATYNFTFGTLPNGTSVDTTITILGAGNVSYGGGTISHRNGVTTIDLNNIQVPDAYCKLLY